MWTETNFNKLGRYISGREEGVAVIAHGEVFAASAKDDKGEAQRLTHTLTVRRVIRCERRDSMKLAFRSEAGSGEASGHNLVMYGLCYFEADGADAGGS